MSEGVRVFVNERAVLVVPGATIREAVVAFDPELVTLLDLQQAYVTDGVGRPVPPTTSVEPGGIFRVVISSRRGARATE
jgi:hypothetical protein